MVGLPAGTGAGERRKLDRLHRFLDLAGAAGLDVEVTQAQADAWAHTLCATAEEVAPGKAHTVGCDRAPWDNGTSFTRPGLADAGNVVAIHPWTSFSGTLKTDPLGAVATDNAERLIQVAQAYATDPARRV